ncbi:hypothetical protein [Acinetobacter sp. ANC 3832]|uniref:hypothetical protein n=1 Tax=Acinetobacter sp. ANC 3832 TaxID=1977874 RepID=UPI000A355D22|nr:hypothetical protein [Acinetobacter sp. ANC 3832]
MKFKLMVVCVSVGLFACSPQQKTADKKTEQTTASEPTVQKVCQPIAFIKLIDNSDWQDLYKDNELEAKDQLKISDIVELTKKVFEDHSDYASGAVGIPLDDVGDLDLDSDTMSVKKDGTDYLIDLKEDNLSFRLPQDFNLNTTLKFREDPDADFAELCSTSDPDIIKIAQFILFKSASTEYLYDLKDQGVL